MSLYSAQILICILVEILTRLTVNMAVNKIAIWWIRYCFTRGRVTIVAPRNAFVTSSATSPAERKPSEWDTGSMCRSPFHRHLCRCVRNKILYVLSWRTVYTPHRMLILKYGITYTSVKCSTTKKGRSDGIWGCLLVKQHIEYILYHSFTKIRLRGTIK